MGQRSWGHGCVEELPVPPTVRRRLIVSSTRVLRVQHIHEKPVQALCRPGCQLGPPVPFAVPFSSWLRSLEAPTCAWRRT